MQTLYACACDIKSNVGFFPLIIIIILILSSLLRVVVVSENAVTRGPRRRRRRRPGTTKKKEKKNWSSSSEVSPKKNEKEKRFLDMKKTQSFDMRGHTPSKKKDPLRTWRLHLHLFRGDFLLFHLGTREKRDAKRREDVGGSRLPPKKVQTIHKKKSNRLSVNPRATERRRHFGGQKTTGEREKRRRRCGVARRTTEPRGP